METFYTSDLHVGHKNVIKYCNRPFSSIEEMNEGIIAGWNKKANKNSVVYHLGDFCFWGTSRVEELYQFLSRLNGQIRLIWGNHDNRRLWTKLFEDYPNMTGRIQILGDLKSVKESGQRIVMCHYPMISWNGKSHGAWHMFGHVHGTLPTTEGMSMDVGIDSHPNFEIYSHDEVVNLMSGKKQTDGFYHDYHAE